MSLSKTLFNVCLLLLLGGCTALETPPGTAVPGEDGPPRGEEFERALAVVDRLEINEVGAEPVQIFVTAFGNLPDGCTDLDEVTQDRNGNRFEVAMTTIRPTGAACTEALIPYQNTFALDVLGLPAGRYSVTVNGVSGEFALPANNIAAGDAEGNGRVSGRVWHDTCGISGGEGGEPAIPGPGCVALSDGAFAADGVYDPAEPGLAGITVSLFAGACPGDGDALQTAITDDDGRYAFAEVPAGSYCVAVEALEEPNLSLLVPGDWTYPSPGSAEAQVTVPPGGDVAGVDFGWDFQYLPVLAPRDCIDRATFLLDVTVPDNSTFDGGATFVKTWRLRNDGTCAWETGYALVFAGGEVMGGPSSMPLPATEPGATVDVSVELVAPDVAGTYRGDWLLRDPLGTTFGIGPTGDGVFWVQIISRGRSDAATAVPTATATPIAGPADGVLGGRVWLDVCHVAGGEGGEPAVPSDGCVADESGGYQANGVMEAAEPGIAGVVVTLQEGICGGPIVATTSTAADGSYAFANLAGGEYCIAVDALGDENALRLIPGGWTTPPADSPVAEVLVTLPASATRADINFGWDFQLD